MITNEDFKRFMMLEKYFLDKKIILPLRNEHKTYDILCRNSSETFFLDSDRRGRLELSKMKIQKRYAITREPLVRIDFDSPPHDNPDGSTTSRNHIHIYREGYGLSWAYDLESFHKKYFKDCSGFISVFIDFCKYCSIDTTKINSVQSVM